MDAAREYFAAGVRRPVEVTPRRDYTIIVTFDNGEKRAYSLRDRLHGIFAPLKDWDKFRQVYVAEGNRAITWSLDGKTIDICPDAVYMRGSPVVPAGEESAGGSALREPGSGSL